MGVVGTFAIALACAPERLPSSSAPSAGSVPSAAPPTGVPLTGVPTTGVPLTGVPTTGVPTTEPSQSPPQHAASSLRALSPSAPNPSKPADGTAADADASRPGAVFAEPSAPEIAGQAVLADAGKLGRNQAPLCQPAPDCAGRSCEECPEGAMLYVPGGRFVMGSDHGGEQDERPAHEVTVSAFWLDRTEVSNRAYERCVAASACRPHDPTSARKNRLGEDVDFRGAAQPISSVSWDDATAYCQFVGKRLPREAEWEKAARGTDSRRFPWGETSPTPAMAVFETGRTANVGSHPQGAGPYGHLDLAGNVWEWVDDIYDPYAYRREGAPHGVPGSCPEVLAAQRELKAGGRQGFTGSNPIPNECERVLRGGAFNYGGAGLRASNRVHHPGRFRLIMSGFRCARDATPEPRDGGVGSP